MGSFLCTSCKTNRDVGTIAIDVWDLIEDASIAACESQKETAIAALDMYSESYTEEKAGLESAFANLQEYVINQGQELFMLRSDALKGNKLAYPYFKQQSNQVDGEGNLHLRGTLQFTYGDVLTAYRAHYKADTEKAEAISPLDEYREIPLCSEDVEITMYRFGGDGEYVLDAIMDKNGAYSFGDVVDEDMHRGQRRICAECGKKLFRATGRADEMVIGLIGSPRSGKTSMFTAMVDSMIDKGLIREFPECSEWREYYNTQLRWYQRGYQASKTQTTRNSSAEEFCYSVLVPAPNGDKVYTYIDMPGEFWTSGNGMTREFLEQYGLVYKAVDCVWMLNSKLTVFCDANIPKDVVKKAADMTANAADLDTLRHNLLLLKDYLGELPPVAVIISKQDLKINHQEVKSAVRCGLYPGDKTGEDFETDAIAVRNEDDAEFGEVFFRGEYIIGEQLQEISRGVRDYLDEYSPTLLKIIEDHFDYRTFVAVAAYGCEAKKRGLVPADSEVKEGSLSIPHGWADILLAMEKTEEEKEVLAPFLDALVALCEADTEKQAEAAQTARTIKGLALQCKLANGESQKKRRGKLNEAFYSMLAAIESPTVQQLAEQLRGFKEHIDEADAVIAAMKLPEQETKQLEGYKPRQAELEDEAEALAERLEQCRRAASREEQETKKQALLAIIQGAENYLDFLNMYRQKQMYLVALRELKKARVRLPAYHTLMPMLWTMAISGSVNTRQTVKRYKRTFFSFGKEKLIDTFVAKLGINCCSETGCSSSDELFAALPEAERDRVIANVGSCLYAPEYDFEEPLEIHL